MRFPVAGGSPTTVISTGLSSPMGLLFRSATRLLIADAVRPGLEYLLTARPGLDRWCCPRRRRRGPCSLRWPGRTPQRRRLRSHDVVLSSRSCVTPLVAPGARASRAEGSVWSGSNLLVASADASGDLLRPPAADGRARVGSRGPSPRIAFSPDGHRCCGQLRGERRRPHDVATGALLLTFGSVLAFLPIDLAYGPDGKRYVACLGAAAEPDRPGRVESLGASYSRLRWPAVSQACLRTDGDLYVSPAPEILRSRRERRLAGCSLTRRATAGCNHPRPRLHHGRLYVRRTSRAREFRPSTRHGLIRLAFVRAAPRAQRTDRVGLGPDGRLYVPSTTTHRSALHGLRSLRWRFRLVGYGVWRPVGSRLPPNAGVLAPRSRQPTPRSRSRSRPRPAQWLA